MQASVWWLQIGGFLGEEGRCGWKEGSIYCVNSWVYIYQTLKSCIFWRFAVYYMPIIPQYSILKKRTSCKKLQLADSLQSQLPHVWSLLQVHTDLSLCLSYSQPVAECGQDTSAGPVLRRVAWRRQRWTASWGSAFLPALLMPVSDLHCSLRLFFFFVILLIYIYFWLYWVFVAVHRLFLVLASGGCSPVVVGGLLIAVVSLVAEHGLEVLGLNCCGTWV